MKKLFSIVAVIALIGMFSCTQKAEGPSQEEFDKLSKEMVDKDTQLAQVQDELEMLTTDYDACVAMNDSLMELTAKKGTYKPKTGTTTTTTTTTTGTGGRGDMKGTSTTTTTATSGGRGDMKKTK